MVSFIGQTAGQRTKNISTINPRSAAPDFKRMMKMELLIGLVIGITISWWWYRGNLKQLLLDMAQRIEDRIKR